MQWLMPSLWKRMLNVFAYSRYRKLLDSQSRAVDADFEKAAEKLKKLPGKRSKP
jgi:hypothetical protein